MLLASTTIGDGTQAGGLTISGGATTTGNAYVAGSLGVGAASPSASLTVQNNYGSSNNNIFSIASSTSVDGSGHLNLFSVARSGATTILNTDSGNPGLAVVGPGNSIATTDFGNNNWNFGAADNTGAHLSGFYVYDNTTSAYRFVISNTSGNIGIATTTPWRTFSVNGNSDLGTSALAGYFVATTSTASIFPYASTTALTISGTASTTALVVSSLGASASQCLTTDISGTVMSQTCGGPFPFTPGVFGAMAVNATGTALQLTGGLLASSTVRFGNAGISGFFFDSTTGKLGLGSTTPWGLLSVNASGLAATAPQFVIGSSTGTDFIVTQNGNIGVGTTSPWSRLSIQANVGDPPSTLFAIGSSSSNTLSSTLFTVDSTGLTTIGDPTATGDANMQFGPDAKRLVGRLLRRRQLVPHRVFDQSREQCGAHDKQRRHCLRTIYSISNFAIRIYTNVR